MTHAKSHVTFPIYMEAFQIGRPNFGRQSSTFKIWKSFKYTGRCNLPFDCRLLIVLINSYLLLWQCIRWSDIYLGILRQFSSAGNDHKADGRARIDNWQLASALHNICITSSNSTSNGLPQCSPREVWLETGWFLCLAIKSHWWIVSPWYFDCVGYSWQSVGRVATS